MYSVGIYEVPGRGWELAQEVSEDNGYWLPVAHFTERALAERVRDLLNGEG